MKIEEYGKENNSIIVMLHGANFVHCYGRQYSLANSFHIIVPHIMGFGDEAGRIFYTDTCCAELVNMIRSLNKKVLLVGFSLGAQLAFKLVSEYPELFYSAIIVSPWLNKTESSLAEVMKMNEKQLQKSRQKNMSGKKTSYPLSGMLRCPDCGRTYRRQLVRVKAYWMCSGRASGATICSSQRMSESDVYEAFNKMLFKLKEHHHAILGALIRDIEIMQSKTSENHEKIAEIDKEIADLAARNLVIVFLSS